MLREFILYNPEGRFGTVNVTDVLEIDKLQKIPDAVAGTRTVPLRGSPDPSESVVKMHWGILPMMLETVMESPGETGNGDVYVAATGPTLVVVSRSLRFMAAKASCGVRQATARPTAVMNRRAENVFIERFIPLG